MGKTTHVWLLAVALTTACTSSPEVLPTSTMASEPDSTTTSQPPPRTTQPPPISIETRHELTLGVDDDGRSEPYDFFVPEDTVSVLVTARGDPDSYLAVASLHLSDGRDVGGLVDTPDERSVLRDLSKSDFAVLPTGMFQGVGHGWHSLLFPNDGTAGVPPGWATLVVASTGHTVDVEITLQSPGRTVLPIDLFWVATDPDEPPRDLAPIVEIARDYFAHAGIDLVVDTSAELNLAVVEYRLDLGPTRQLRRLIERSEAIGSSAIDVFVVPFLVGDGVTGLAPSTPGPAMPSDVGGVYVLNQEHDVAMAWTLVHELGHYAGLYHVRNSTGTGGFIDDPLPDTSWDEQNVMSNGSTITDDQRQVFLNHPIVVDFWPQED